MVDIQNRFINIQGTNRQRFTWFLLCVGKISNEKRVVTRIYKYGLCWVIAVHYYLTQYVIMVDIERRVRNIQEINRYRCTWFLLCVGKISN